MAEAIVAIRVEMSTFCHPPSPAFFFSKSTNPSSKNKDEIIYALQIEASLGIIFWFKAITEIQITSKCPPKDFKGMLFVPKHVSLKIRKKTFNF